MSRQKLPVRATYRQVAHSPNHEYPWHLVGMIEDQKRYVITGLTDDSAKELYEKLKEHFNGNESSGSVARDTQDEQDYME